MQPHLKKCFEGIAQLTFTPQLIIVGMESVEGEKVGFSTSLNPAEANGMVEKWLLQVRPANPHPNPNPNTHPTSNPHPIPNLSPTLTPTPKPNSSPYRHPKPRWRAR